MAEENYFSNINENPRHPRPAPSYGHYGQSHNMMMMVGGPSAGYNVAAPSYGMQHSRVPPSGAPMTMMMQNEGISGEGTYGMNPDSFQFNENSIAIEPDAQATVVVDAVKEKPSKTSQKRTKTKRKKSKDKPKRPLSAYNLFFQEERGKILNRIPSSTSNDVSGVEEGKDAGGKDDKIKKEYKDKEEVNNKSQCQGKKRPHPHGKISFEKLAKTIGKRWKELSPARLAHYKALASKDTERYRQEMAVYATKVEQEKLRSKTEVVQERTSKMQKIHHEMGHRRNSEGGKLKGAREEPYQQLPNPNPTMPQYAFGGVWNNAMGAMGVQPAMPVGMPMSSQQHQINPYPSAMGQEQPKQQQDMITAPAAPPNFGVGVNPYGFPSYPPNYAFGQPVHPNHSGVANYGCTGWQSYYPSGNPTADEIYGTQQTSPQTHSEPSNQA